MSQPVRPDHAIELEAEIGLHQCDPLGIVWHGRYFEWFEMARSKLFASRDLEVHQIRELGYRLYIVETTCRYMAPLSYGDRAVVKAWYSAVEPLIRVAYDVRHGETDQWCGRATTVLATTDAAGKLLARTPDGLLERLPRR